MRAIYFLERNRICRPYRRDSCSGEAACDADTITDAVHQPHPVSVGDPDTIAFALTIGNPDTITDAVGFSQPLTVMHGDTDHADTITDAVHQPHPVSVGDPVCYAYAVRHPDAERDAYAFGHSDAYSFGDADGKPLAEPDPQPQPEHYSHTRLLRQRASGRRP